MRKALRPNPQKQQLARGNSIPAPVEGWDAISSEAAMPETRALTLDNWFPQPGYIEIRGGAKRHRRVTGTARVDSVMAYHGLTNNFLFAASGSNISDVSASATATASVAVSGLSNARWQHVNYSGTGGNFLWIANGVDAPRFFDGSTWTTASIANITAADIIQPAVFKERLWFTRSGSISPAYLPVDTVQGSAAVFDLTGVFEKGGVLQAIGSWNFGGDGPDNFIAFLTSRGEVAVYSGSDPNSATTFAHRGTYPVGRPLGRRALTKVQGDLAIISVDGLLPLAKYMMTERGAAATIALTKLIQPIMNQSARLYAANFGFQLTPYPRGTMAILNIPVGDGADQVQYVMNTVTGAWCRFLGLPANCFEVFGTEPNDRLFFGGNNGFVYEADAQGFDEDAPIEYNLETAFNYFGARGQLKHFSHCRPIIATDGTVNPGLTLNTDFARDAEISVPEAVTETQALWDVALWDVALWGTIRGMVTDWRAAAGEGYCASIRMAGAVQAPDSPSQDLLLRVMGFDVLMMDGGLI